MPDVKEEPLDSLLKRINDLDRTFEADRGHEMGDFFSDDGRLMWPLSEDIAGRERIRAAFVQLIETFTTISWKPEREVLEICGNKAFLIGRFIEERALRDDGSAERVYGRLFEMWSRRADGRWELAYLMTSRYGESEAID